jgi:hypothetical protein
MLTVLLSSCIEDPEFSGEVIGGGKPVFKGGAVLVAKTASSIEFSAEILKENGYKITERGFVWSTSQHPTVESGHKITLGTGIGEYTHKIENLSGNTTYYIRPYAMNEQGTEYGQPELAETTNHGLGRVTTNNVTARHAASVTVGGTIDDAGEGEIICRGIYYSPSKIFQTKDSVTSDDITDEYHCQLTGLTPSTTYYYVAFVTNTFGDFEGMIDSVTTKDGLAQIGLAEAMDLGYNDVKLHSVVSNADDTTVQIIKRGFHWGSDLAVTNTVQAGEGNGSFEVVISNLEAQKQYYAYAYAETPYGTVYSDTISFFTKTDLPIVRTEAPEHLENAKVDLSCTLIAEGKSDLLSIGIYWSTSNTTPTSSDNILPLVRQGVSSRYSRQLTKLKGGVTYYIRAYATNGEGTSVGEEVKQFTAPPIFTAGLAAFRGDYLLQKSNAYFSIGDSLYIVGGDKGPGYSNELWRYSIPNNDWLQLRSLTSGPAKWQTGITYGRGAFVFGGLGEDGLEKNSFMYYDASSENAWLPYPSGIDSIHSAISFATGNSVYIVGGKSGNTVKKTVWRYDLGGGIWSRKTDFPEPQYGGIAVVINGVVYAGMGRNIYGRCNGNLWTSDDDANTWWHKTYLYTYTGGILGGIAYGENIYVIDEFFYIHEFNTRTNRWAAKSNLPATYSNFNCIFENNGKIYIGLGSAGNSFIIYSPVWDNYNENEEFF